VKGKPKFFKRICQGERAGSRQPGHPCWEDERKIAVKDRTLTGGGIGSENEQKKKRVVKGSTRLLNGGKIQRGAVRREKIAIIERGGVFEKGGKTIRLKNAEKTLEERRGR